MTGIVVGLDGSDAARDAARWAADLVPDVSDTLVLVFAAPVAMAAEAAREHLRGWSTAALAARPGCSPDLVVRAGDPEQVITNLADAMAAELVVVGERRPGASVGRDRDRPRLPDRLAHRLAVPVAVVPEGSPRARKGPVVVGVDGTDGSRTALSWAKRVAVGLHADIGAVLADDPTADTYGHPHDQEWKYPHQLEAEAVVESVAPGGDVSLRLIGGEPSDVLARTAAAEAASMVVVGTRSHGPATGTFLGRVPMALLHESPVPAVVVRSDTDLITALLPSPASVMPPVELEAGQGHRVVDANVEDAVAIVHDAELHGADPAHVSMSGAELAPTPSAVQRNDAANMAAATRPAIKFSALTGAAVGVVVGLGAFALGVGVYWALLVGLAGALVGSTLGALWGMYSHLAVHPGVTDRRGAPSGQRVTIVEDRDGGEAQDHSSRPEHRPPTAP